MRWFGVRCVFLWRPQGTYEERLTMWRVESPERALELAEKEAATYADEHEGIEFLGLLQAYDTRNSGEITDGFEAFSLLRDDDDEPDGYLDRFFDTGAERQRPPSGG